MQAAAARVPALTVAGAAALAGLGGCLPRLQRLFLNNVPDALLHVRAALCCALLRVLCCACVWLPGCTCAALCCALLRVRVVAASVL